jgi:membrane associated rhomboid family serine protease
VELSLGARLVTFLKTFGFVPSRFALEVGHGNLLDAALPIFTSMFLHGGWLHLIGNMWTLFIFGDNVEDTLGHGPFLLFYLLTGLVAVLAQFVVAPGSRVPVVGASGAIAGVMGAYFYLFPKARVLTLVPILFFVVIEVPAYVFLGFWFLMQFWSGTLAVLGPSAKVGGVAFWAHVGGFVAGFLLLIVFLPSQAKERWQKKVKPA